MNPRQPILIAIAICASLVVVVASGQMSQSAQDIPIGQGSTGLPQPPSALGQATTVDAIPFAELNLSSLPDSAPMTRGRAPSYSNQLGTYATNTSSPVVAADPFFQERSATAPNVEELPGPLDGDGVVPAQVNPAMTSPRSTLQSPAPIMSGTGFVPGSAPPISSGAMALGQIAPGQIYSTPYPSSPAAQVFGPSHFATPSTGTGSLFSSPAINHGTVCGCGCQPACTTATIYVPHWETRYVHMMQTRYRQELRQKKYQTQHVVYDDVPKTEAYSVMVPEQRTRTFTVNQKEEFQVPVQENFTVMVPKPQQREVSVDREEDFQVPIETPYTVMVPVKKEVQETKYKTVIDKEPYQKRYVVEVAKERMRVVTSYEKEALEKTVRKAVTKMVDEPRTRKKVEYVTKVGVRDVVEKYIAYQEVEEEQVVQKFRTERRSRMVDDYFVEYENMQDEYTHTENTQRPREIEQPIEYKVSVPYTEQVEETYYENVPYEEEIVKSIPIKIQTPRTVTKTYEVKLPFTEHVSQTYTVKVPYEVVKTAYRVITRQVPVTKYRTITRDMGSWKKETCASPTCSIFQDACGCATCTAGMQHTYKNTWCPKIVRQRIPYTDFRDVPQRVPYKVVQVLQRDETRSRRMPITKYQTETRTANLTVMDYSDSERTESYKVTKYRWVPRTRQVNVKRVREETRKKMLPLVEYDSIEKPKSVPYQYRTPKPAVRKVEEFFTVRIPYTEKVMVKVTRPVEKTRTIQEEFVYKEPVITDESYTVKVAQVDYVDSVKTEYVDIPVNRKVKYTEMVPEFRTKTAYRDVPRKVPYFETKTVTQMVPQIKTRTTYRTETRTVADIKIKTFMKMVPEVRTKTVYKTRFRDVPKIRTETYWVDVPEKRFRTKMIRVPSKVTREHVRNYTVNIPYQVSVCIPQRTCRMVAKTITIPVEQCCNQCGQQFPAVHDAAGAYLQYGYGQVQSAWDRIINR